MSDQELDLRRNLFSGRVDQFNRMGLALAAKELGLDPVEYAQPFPGNKSVTINNFPPSEPAPQPVTPPVAKPVAAVNRPGLSPLAGIALGLLTVAVPAAGAIGYLLNTAPAVISTIEKVVEKPGPTITLPGQRYGVDVNMTVEPPGGSQ